MLLVLFFAADAGLCLAMGVVLVAGYHTLHPQLLEGSALSSSWLLCVRPVWLIPFGIVFEGVSLAWFYLIQKEPPRWRLSSETGTGGSLAPTGLREGPLLPEPCFEHAGVLSTPWVSQKGRIILQKVDKSRGILMPRRQDGSCTWQWQSCSPRHRRLRCVL